MNEIFVIFFILGFKINEFTWVFRTPFLGADRVTRLIPPAWEADAAVERSLRTF